jgi:NAD(P)-dependent dehydrogenase (short-subunit alcohol dehydrogenase family)
MTMSVRPRLLVTGIAEGLGADIAGTFARAGYDVIGLSRASRASDSIGRLVELGGGRYSHLACDITHPADVADVLRPVADGVDVLIHNAQQLLIKTFAEISADEFEQVWRVACLGAMASAQAVLPHMARKKRGTVIFSGATAGLRGGAKFSAFASAKFALRGLAQALAREFGPKGVHVAHVVIDGLIEAPQTDRRFGLAASGRMEAEAVAQAYLALAAQHASAWTQEMDLRPFAETF